MSGRSLTGKRIALYARFSSDRQSDASIDDQLHRCREYVAKQGGTVDGALVFTDYAVSGASMARVGLEALLAAIGAGKVDAVILEDVSRLSRDLADSAAILKRLNFEGVRLVGVADGVDTIDKSAKLTFGVRALLGDVYLDDLRDKTRRGLAGRHRSGKATGGLPFGYVSTRTSKGSEISIDE
ncbi:MAG: recombinase family protein, partial [Myxococcota bacterium]